MPYLTIILAAFLITLAIMPFVIRSAAACKCMDVPAKRHFHKKSTPRWGGIAFFLGVVPMVFFLDTESAWTSYAIASCIILGIGIIDDRFSLGCKIKFLANIVAATIVIFSGNTVVHTLGSSGSFGSVELGWFAIPFTYLGIVGVTNAINLLDGLNGLAGGVSLLGFLFLGIAAAAAGNFAVAMACFAFVGALTAFLLFNFPKARIFMGDSGSLFLGFSLSVMAIAVTQSASAPVSPIFPVLVLLIPLFDTLRVMIMRVLRKRHPFQADKSHLHHLLVRSKISPVTAVLLLWATTAVFGVTGLLMLTKSLEAALAFVLYACLLLSFFAISLTWRRRARKGVQEELHEVVRGQTDTQLAKFRT